MMKSLFKSSILGVVILLVSFSLCRAQDFNETPMFRDETRTGQTIRAKQMFIENAIRQFGSIEAASKWVIAGGWRCILKKDGKSAIRYFNRAWLLTPDKAEVYWGLGSAVAFQGKFEEAVKFFSRAHDLDPNNGRLLCDFGFLYQFYALKGSKTKEETMKMFDTSIDLFRKASLLDPDYDRIYFNWAVSLYFKEDYRGAWEKIEMAERHGGKSINRRFIQDLTKKMPRPHDRYALPGTTFYYASLQIYTVTAAASIL